MSALAHFFILIGPSGAGKTTVLERLLQEPSLKLTRALTTTSRPLRDGEMDGIDYHFVSREQFQSMIAEEALFEWTEIYGQFYGTERVRLEALRKTANGIVGVLEPIGAQKIKQADPAHTTIILLDVPKESLLKRLKARSFSPEELVIRLARIDRERDQYPSLADVRINNFDGALEETLASIKELIKNKI